MRGLALLVSLVAAQVDLPDAGLPDASVGASGAERASEEQDTMSTASATCLSEADCDRGFACIAGKCSYRRYREATVEGCSSADGLWAVGVLLALRRRHFFAKFTK
jgi:hypothetical protein